MAHGIPLTVEERASVDVAPAPSASGAFTASLPRYRVPWAELLKKVFAVDALECPDCGGTMKLIAFIAEEATARRILEHLGLDAALPPLARAQAPPEQLDPGPDYDVSDPPPPTDPVRPRPASPPSLALAGAGDPSSCAPTIASSRPHPRVKCCSRRGGGCRNGTYPTRFRGLFGIPA